MKEIFTIGNLVTIILPLVSIYIAIRSSKKTSQDATRQIESIKELSNISINNAKKLSEDVARQIKSIKELSNIAINNANKSSKDVTRQIESIKKLTKIQLEIAIQQTYTELKKCEAEKRSISSASFEICSNKTSPYTTPEQYAHWEERKNEINRERQEMSSNMKNIERMYRELLKMQREQNKDY